MNLALVPDDVLNRRPGKRRLFEGERLTELLEFLKDPDKTHQDAADHFNCSPSTVSHRLQKLRREKAGSRHETPRPDAAAKAANSKSSTGGKE